MAWAKHVISSRRIVLDIEFVFIEKFIICLFVLHSFWYLDLFSISYETICRNVCIIIASIWILFNHN